MQQVACIHSSVRDNQLDNKHEVCLYKNGTSCLALIISDQKGFLRLHCNASRPHDLFTTRLIMYASKGINSTYQVFVNARR